MKFIVLRHYRKKKTLPILRHGCAGQPSGEVKSCGQRLLKFVVGLYLKAIKILRMKLRGSNDGIIFNTGRNRAMLFAEVKGGETPDRRFP